LMAFDLPKAIPKNSLILSASLNLTVTKVSPANPVVQFTLHKVSQLWGEGASDAGSNGGSGAPAQTDDATWTQRLFPAEMWTTPGGVFNPAVSGTKSIGGLGTYTFNDAGLANDVRSWMTNQSENVGWILIGENTVGSAKQFASGEDANPAIRPKLTVNYKSAAPLTRREQWLQAYFFVGQFVDDFADNDGDGFNNAIEYAAAASPIAAAPTTPPIQISAVNAGANTTFTITFRRDPRATDLTYRLQTSPDLGIWLTVVQSVAGGAPAGLAFVSDIEIPGEAPVRLVTARETTPVGSKRFARLQVVRQ
jgi:hypothetical protein